VGEGATVLTGEVLDRLARVVTIDLTTRGRHSGLPRRIEIWWFRVDGRFVITGTPGRRDWFANVLGHPRVVVHVDGFDIEAPASVVTDLEFRRRVFTGPGLAWYRTQAGLEDLLTAAPMIEVHLETG